METNKNGIRSIWFFVGLILLLIGLMVVAAGIAGLVYGQPANVKLAELHTSIWWGLVITAAGLIYTIKNRNKYIGE